MKLFILTGPTFAGVTTLAEYIVLKNSDMLLPVVSFTTRKQLSQEVYGREYYFINDEQYLQLKIHGDIKQEANYLDRRYGLTKQELNRFKESGKHGVAAMGMPGVQAMRRFLGEENIVSLFIYRDLSIIRSTLLEMGLPTDEISKRYELAKKEMQTIACADYVVYNVGSLDEAYNDIMKIIFQVINAKKEEAFLPGEIYNDYLGENYETLELVKDYYSWQPMMISRNLDQNVKVVQKLSAFKAEMTKHKDD